MSRLFRTTLAIASALTLTTLLTITLVAASSAPKSNGAAKKQCVLMLQFRRQR